MSEPKGGCQQSSLQNNCRTCEGRRRIGCRGSAALEAPDEVKSWADKMDGLKTNNAIIILEDGSATEPVGARKLEEALAEAEGAQGLVFAGKVNDRIFDLASGAGIGNVLGKTVGKDTLKGGVHPFRSKICEV